ncbi:MAG: N-acetylmuramoyl-L-alanine amidase [Cocleimonas sp.]|nr:N-acetylmuramoyl-L-alanine amidase [Cocleimonas sp.]
MKIFLTCFLISLPFYATRIMANNKAVIAIDIGHTQQKSGATSARGVSEFQFNQVIARKLHSQLNAYGYNNSFIINPKGKNISLKNRNEQAHRRGATVFISIHHDSMQTKFLKEWEYKGNKYLHGEKFKGFSLFISQTTAQKKENLNLARAISNQMLRQGFTPTLHHAMPIKGENRTLLDKKRGIYEFSELAVLRRSIIPAVLVECGVIVNKDEERLLRNNQYQNKISQSLADGIIQYLKSTE